MYNGWPPYLPYPPSPPAESYPTPAPTPQVNEAGMPIPPSIPRRRPAPLPPTPFGDSSCHPLLLYSSCPCIEYDVRQRPVYASAPNARLEWAYEPATNPPTRELIITCMILPRPFVVRPACQDYNFVTILDILAATHRAFRDAMHVATAHQSGLPWAPCWQPPIERVKWAGLSDQRTPGNWILHIE